MFAVVAPATCLYSLLPFFLLHLYSMHLAESAQLSKRHVQYEVGNIIQFSKIDVFWIGCNIHKRTALPATWFADALWVSIRRCRTSLHHDPFYLHASLATSFINQSRHLVFACNYLLSSATSFKDHAYHVNGCEIYIHATAVRYMRRLHN